MEAAELMKTFPHELLNMEIVDKVIPHMDFQMQNYWPGEEGITGRVKGFTSLYLEDLLEKRYQRFRNTKTELAILQDSVF